jgi:hypothetical protein
LRSRTLIVARPQPGAGTVRATLRPATTMEVARLTAESAMLLARRQKDPQQARALRELARGLLRSHFADGELTPELLATCGLCEFELDQRGAAFRLLEDAAAQRPLVRPRAALALAILRYETPRGLSESGRIDLAAARSVLAPLRGWRELPPEAYRFMVEVWRNTVGELDDDELLPVYAGAMRFPEDLDLTYGAANVCLRFGRLEEAALLVSQGLRYAPNEMERRRFNDLKVFVAAGR